MIPLHPAVLVVVASLRSEQLSNAAIRTRQVSAIRSCSPETGEQRKPSSNKARERINSLGGFFDEEGAAAHSASCTGGSNGWWLCHFRFDRVGQKNISVARSVRCAFPYEKAKPRLPINYSSGDGVFLFTQQHWEVFLPKESSLDQHSGVQGLQAPVWGAGDEIPCRIFSSAGIN